MRIERSLVLLALGCGRVNFDQYDAAATAPDVSPFAPDAGFADPVPLLLGASDPQLSTNGLTLWVTVNGAGTAAIAVALRTTTTEQFGAPNIEPLFDSGAREVDPAITADELTLMFVRETGTPLLESSRQTPTAPWNAPVPASGLEAFQLLRSIDLSPDGLVVYFETSDFIVRRASRPDRASAFGTPVAISAPRVSYFTISPDELSLFGNREDNSGTVWAARARPEDPFVEQGTLSLGAMPCFDPDVSPDGHTLVIKCGTVNDLYVLSR